MSLLKKMKEIVERVDSEMKESNESLKLWEQFLNKLYEDKE